MSNNTRRTVLKGGVAMAGALTLGFPSIVRAQSDKIKIGHLTPLTGFLGRIGAYAQLGVELAAEEINASGGVMGRQIESDRRKTWSIRRPARPRRNACWSRTAPLC